MGWLWDFNYLSIALLLAAALRWGAAPERLCVAALLAMILLDRLYHALVGRGTIYASVDIGHLIIDLLVAAAFIAVALLANRMYPLWLAAFQLLSVISHFAREASGSVAKLAYGVLNYAPYLAIVAILAGGIWSHARRRSIYGPYPSWRRSSGLSPARGPKRRPGS